MNQQDTILQRTSLVLLSTIGFGIVSVAVFAKFTTQLGSLVFALLIGCIGAAVSLARRIPKLNDDERAAIASSWWSVTLPCIVGFVMGGILYFLFMAKILTGDVNGQGLFSSNLFPAFSDIKKNENELLNMQHIMSIRPASLLDFGKLLVWCFLSGFSERLVPNVLLGLQSKVVDTPDSNPETE